MAKQPSNTMKSARIVIGAGVEVSQKQYAALLEFCIDRLEFGKEHRDAQAQKYESIDKEIVGDLQLGRDDKKRKRDTDQGKGVKPYDTSLPLTHKQLEDSVTNLLSILAGDDGLYSVIAAVDQQQAANSLVAIMNRHADMFGHIRHMNISLNHMLRYNFGGNIVEWETVLGNRIKNSTNAVTAEIERNVVVRAGNSMPAIDPYNFLCDWSVTPANLFSDGEFFATVEPMMPFQLRKLRALKKLHGDGIDKYINNQRGVGTELRFYHPHPTLRSNDSVGATDFVSILTMSGGKSLGAASEMVYLYTWIEAKKYGLNRADGMSIWRFGILNGEVIADAVELNNAHGMLPVALGTPIEDGFQSQTKSYGEMLLPFQRFASAQMNMHQRASRKKLNGVTFFNERLFPLLNNADEDLSAGRIPFTPPQENDSSFDVNKHIKTLYDAPETINTSNEIRAMMEMMNHILPTDQLRQVTDLDRATQYQAAATVQGSNRGNWRLAKLIDIQHMTPIRFMQYYNVLQYQETLEMLDANGKTVQIDPAMLREAKLEFSIAEGIKALDKLTVSNNMKEVIRWMLQSQRAMTEFDMASMINYWTSTSGDKTDFRQFKYKSPLDQLSPEEKQAAFELYQQAVQAQQQGQQ